jgi:hypothetical protein
MVVGQEVVMVGQVVAGLRGRPQIVQLHRSDMAKRSLEKRRVAAMGLGIVVNPAKRFKRAVS